MPPILSIGFIDNIENDQILTMIDADIDNELLTYQVDLEVNLSTFSRQVPALQQNCEPFELTALVNLERNEVGIHSYVTYFKNEDACWLRVSR
jgi:hypothetical protein